MNFLFGLGRFGLVEDVFVYVNDLDLIVFRLIKIVLC